MANVLVVDDSNTMRELVSGFLRTHGFDVVTATDGRDGLDKLRNDPAIALVVSDINMPVMDGLTMIRQLRAKPAHQGVPIIFLTTESDADIKAQAKSAGATGWLTKPFDPDQLIRIVKKVLAS